MAKKEQNEKIAREMHQHVNTWQASKMSAEGYCADKELGVHKLYYWFNKIKKEQADTPGTNTGFTRVRPKEIPPAAQDLPTSALPSLEVNLSNGTRLVFYQAISKDLLNVFL